MFYNLKDVIPNTIVLTTHTLKKVNTINDNSTIGEQIKHYRKLADIKQADLSEKLGYSRGLLLHLENEEMKLVDVDLLKAIIKELNIEDKIVINDDYIKFLLDNPSKTIFDLRQKMNLTIPQFANMLDVSRSAVRFWENGKSQITRKMFDKLKKSMS